MQGPDAALRVAVDATPLLGARTGVGTFCAELTDRLAARGDVDLVAFAVTWRGRHDLAAKVPTGTEVITRPLPARPARMAWRRGRVPPIEWWTGPVDLVHGPNAVVPPTEAAPRVLTLHDLTAVHFPEMCTADVLHYPDLVRRAVADGAWVHTISHHVGQEAVEILGVPPERLVVVPNGRTELPPADPVVGRALVGAERYLLFLGTIEPRKDLRVLVESFDAVSAAHPDVRLVLAGPDGWATKDLEHALASAHHADRVLRLGWVDDSARAALLAGASALVYPSRYEGFGLPVLEGNAAGIPVVATTGGAVPEVAGDAAVLVPVGDRDALAEGIERVLTDDGLRASLVAAGQRNLERYSWDTTTDGLLDLYRRAIGADDT